MKFVIDTSAYSAFNRGDLRLKPWIHPSHEIVMPLVVIGELRAGFAGGNRRAENEHLLQKFLDSPNIATITLTVSTTGKFADIFNRLRKSGKPIGTNDMWISALALEHGLPVLTLDSDFSRISGLTLVEV